MALLMTLVREMPYRIWCTMQKFMKILEKAESLAKSRGLLGIQIALARACAPKFGDQLRQSAAVSHQSLRWCQRPEFTAQIGRIEFLSHLESKKNQLF